MVNYKAYHGANLYINTINLHKQFTMLDSLLYEPNLQLICKGRLLKLCAIGHAMIPYYRNIAIC